MIVKSRLFAATAFTAVAFAGAVAATPAAAVPIFVTVNKDLTTGPFTFTFNGGTFTFSATGDWFNPIGVQTAGNGAINTVFGEPTTNFVDRGTVTFGPGDQFAAFPTTTTVRFSNGENFIGLRAGMGQNFYYGFAYTTNTQFNLYAFESTPNQPITASVTAPVPEPATWAMLVVGFGAIGGAARYRRRAARVAYA